MTLYNLFFGEKDETKSKKMKSTKTYIHWYLVKCTYILIF